MIILSIATTVLFSTIAFLIIIFLLIGVLLYAKAKLVPSGEALEFQEGEGRVRFTVPSVKGHQMVEVDYVQ